MNGARPRDRSRTSRRILQAATAEFAARGYAGAGVDRIARRARVNKALLYYYYGPKQQLYAAVMRAAFAALRQHLEAAVAGDADPAAQLDRYVAAFVAARSRLPHLPALMLREVADGGRHLDAETLTAMVAILPVIRGVLAAGERQGVFRRADPILTHFVITGATIVFLANAPLRRRVRALGLAHPPAADAPFVRYLQSLLHRSLLEGCRP